MNCLAPADHQSHNTILQYHILRATSQLWHKAQADPKISITSNISAIYHWKTYTNSMELSHFSETTISAVTKDLPNMIWSPKVYCYVHNGPPTVPFLSQINSVHITPSYLSTIHFKIIHLTHLYLGLPNGLSPSGLPTSSLNAFLFYPIHAACPAPLFSLTRSFWLCLTKIKVMKLLVARTLYYKFQRTILTVLTISMIHLRVRDTNIIIWYQLSTETQMALLLTAKPRNLSDNKTWINTGNTEAQQLTSSWKSSIHLTPCTLP
jgi:hypothetical protein